MKKTVVIKAGGELMGAPLSRQKIFSDLKTWQKKANIVFIHGGGPQIESELVKNNIPSQFIQGRRTTSPEAMIIIERVLSGEINKSLVAELGTMKVKAVGLSCRDGNMIKATPIQGLGRAAKPVHINTDLINTLISSGYIPVISSVGSDSKGNSVNINADDVASAIACAMKASNLILLTNISGVLDHMKNRIPILKTKEIPQLISNKVISGGMIPKVESAKLAIQKGVGEVDIVNGFHGLSFNYATRILK